ncbi:MAG: hypothetical protein AABW52_05815, partial [Nanoarchaeota archaeon]
GASIKDFNTPDIVLDNNTFNLLYNIPSNNVLFVILPIYNRTFDSTMFRYGNFIDLSSLNLSREYYIDFEHYSAKGNELIAEKICEALKSGTIH